MDNDITSSAPGGDTRAAPAKDKQCIFSLGLSMEQPLDDMHAVADLLGVLTAYEGGTFADNRLERMINFLASLIDDRADKIETVQTSILDRSRSRPSAAE